MRHNNDQGIWGMTDHCLSSWALYTQTMPSIGSLGSDTFTRFVLATSANIPLPNTLPPLLLTTLSVHTTDHTRPHCALNGVY